MEEKKPSLWDKTKNWIMGITTLVVAGGGTAYVVNEISQDEHKDKTEKTVDPKTEEKDEGTELDKQMRKLERQNVKVIRDEKGHTLAAVGVSYGNGKYEDEDSHVRLMQPTPGSKEARMLEESKKFMESIKIERFGNKSEKGIGTGGKAQRLTGMPIIPVIKREKTEQEQAQEFTDRIRRETSVARGENIGFSTADKNAIEVEGHQMSKGASIGYGKYEDTENDYYASFAGTKEDLQAKAQKKLADAIVEKILFGKHKKVTLADVRAKSENLQQKKKGTDTPAPQPNAAEDQNRDAVLPKQTKLTSTRSKGGRKGGELEV